MARSSVSILRVLLSIGTAWTVFPGQAIGGPAEGKLPARLVAEDALVSPNQEARIAVVLEADRAQGSQPAPGEPIELLQDGKVVASTTTDSAGRATVTYTPKAKGSVLLSVQVGNASRLSAAVPVVVAAWERRTPLLAIELASLEANPGSQEPAPDAADELGKLTYFYYNLLYVAASNEGEGSRAYVASRKRQWLVDHKFPPGYIVVVPASDGAFGSKLDDLRKHGWSMLKIGVGRSRQFAETFLQRRLDAVLVPDPGKGETPRKAKVAKDWKEVRKKL